ncbi:MAG: hypothetical protein ABSF70_00025 [Terracidiphilus sp.]
MVSNAATDRVFVGGVIKDGKPQSSTEPVHQERGAVEEAAFCLYPAALTR